MYENSEQVFGTSNSHAPTHRKPFKSLVGVRQGDVLSPNLFQIFINDLTTYLSSSLDPVYLNDKRLD